MFLICLFYALTIYFFKQLIGWHTKTNEQTHDWPEGQHQSMLHSKLQPRKL